MLLNKIRAGIKRLNSTGVGIAIFNRLLKLGIGAGIGGKRK